MTEPGLFSRLKDTIGSLAGGGNDLGVEDQGMTEKAKKIISDLYQSIQSPNVAFEVFEKNLIFLKGFAAVLIITLAVVNYLTYKDVGLISKKPLLFFAESVLFGLSGAIPFLMLCLFRRNIYTNEKLITIAIGLFIVFFAMNYMLELGGVYSAAFYSEEVDGSHPKKPEEVMTYAEKMKSSLARSSNIMVMILLVLCLFMVVFSAYFVKNYSTDYKDWASPIPVPVVFVTEMLLFGAISAAPIYFMAYNRNALSKSTTKEFLLITAKFSILHCLLQVSGFYQYALNDTIQ